MIFPDSWKMGAVAAVFAAVVSLIAWLAVSRAGLKAELAQARANYAVCESANADWAVKAGQVNEALRRMSDEAAARQKKAGQAQKRAEREAAKHANRAQAILSVQGSDDACRDAHDLIRGYVQEKR